MREISSIRFVGGIGFGAELIGAGIANVTNQFFEVVIVFCEFGDELIKQLLVDRWVADGFVSTFQCRHRACTCADRVSVVRRRSSSDCPG